MRLKTFVSLINPCGAISHGNQRNRVGVSGGSGAGIGRIWPLKPRTEWRLTMNANIPVLPIAGGTLVRALLALVALVTSWLKRFSRARQNRRQAAVLAGLDRLMLADIGITRADLRDAFSEPFWDDPTALLRERAPSRWRTVSVDRRPIARRARRSEAFLRGA